MRIINNFFFPYLVEKSSHGNVTWISATQQAIEFLVKTNSKCVD